MKQLSPRMTGTEIEIEMQIHALRRRVEELEITVRLLQATAPVVPPVPASSSAEDDGPRR